MIQTSTATDRVSVIIPAYNRAHDLPGVVETVLAQTHPVHEVLIVDDGSSDHTAQVARALPGPVRYIHQENQGVSGARNRGLAEAAGNFVALLDTDDRWDPRKLELQLAAMRAHPEVGWSCTDLLIVDAAGTPVRGSRTLSGAVPVFRKQRRSVDAWLGSRLSASTLGDGGDAVACFHGDAFGLLLHGNFVFPSTVLFRRTLAESMGGFDTGFPRAEDTEYFLRLANVSHLFFVSAPLMRYRVGSSDALSNTIHTVELTEFALLALERAAAGRPDLSEYERGAIEAGRRRILLDQAYAHLSNFDSGAARRSLAALRSARPRIDLTAAGILALSLLPRRALSGIGATKRAIRRGAGA